MLEIRPYRQSDWKTIQRIHDFARKIELRFAELDGAFLPLYVAAEREGLFEYNVDVAALDGDTVGFCAYSDEEFAWLYVYPGLHRKGIGRALLEHALEREPGIREVEVLAGNTPARALYESCGFFLSETVHGVMPGNEQFPVTVWRFSRKTGE